MNSLHTDIKYLGLEIVNIYIEKYDGKRIVEIKKKLTTCTLLFVFQFANFIHAAYISLFSTLVSLCLCFEQDFFSVCVKKNLHYVKLCV